MERALRIRFVLSLLLCLVAACETGPSVDDRGGVAGMGGRGLSPASASVRVLMSRAPVPVGGAIVFESFESGQPAVEFRNPSGALILGHYNYLGSNPLDSERMTTYYAWRPAHPFTPGRYTVTFHNFATDIPTVVPITVVEAFDAELPALDAEPTANSLVAPTRATCCRTPEGEPARQCAIDQQRTALVLDLALSSSTAGPLNQYFFRIAPTQESGASDALQDFLPFSMLSTVTFFDTRDEYCVELELQNVATLEYRAYPELRLCVPAGDIEVGLHGVALDAAFFELDACPTPPDGLTDPWCAVNAPGCAANAATKCAPVQPICFPNRYPR